MKIIKKLFGLDKLEASIQKAEQDLAEANNRLAAAEAASKTAEQAEETAKLSPKERVNKDNIRNGFFELDWNDQFVLQLKQEGYGEDGDKEEEIVDRWFRELCANVVVDGDFGGPVNTGVIDIKTVKKTNQ